MTFPAATFTFTAELWESQVGGWVFVTLPEDASEEIRDVPRDRRGFGSVRVEVRIGGSRWATSVFPDSTLGRYILPVKKAVRTAEQVGPGDPVEVVISSLE